MDNKLNRSIYYILCMFLMCYFMQIINFAHYIDLSRVFNWVAVLVAVALCIIMAIKQRKTRIDVNICLLLITVGIYFVKKNGMVESVLSPYSYVPIVVYLIAHYISGDINMEENSDEQFMFFLMLMIVGITIHGILNSCIFLEGTFCASGRRHWMDIWSGEFIAGTLHVEHYLPVFTTIIPAIICLKNNKTSKIYAIFTVLATLFFLYVSIVSKSRMPIVIFPIVIVMQIVLYGITRDKNIQKSFNLRKVIFIISVVIVFGIIVMSLVLKSAEMQSFLSIMDRDGGIFNNIRFRIQRSALEQLVVYPMGGNQMDHLGYPHTHNAWLDIADIGGVIPFFVFTIYTVLTLYEMLKMVTKRQCSTELKTCVLGLYLVYFLFFTVEPSLDYSVHIMTPWLFLHGMVHGYIAEKNVAWK